MTTVRKKASKKVTKKVTKKSVTKKSTKKKVTRKKAVTKKLIDPRLALAKMVAAATKFAVDNKINFLCASEESRHGTNNEVTMAVHASSTVAKLHYPLEIMRLNLKSASSLS